MENDKSVLEACKTEDIEQVKIDLDLKPETINQKDEDGNSPLIWASENNLLDIFLLLCNQPNIDVNLQENNAGFTCLFILSGECLELVLKHGGFDVNQYANKDLIDTNNFKEPFRIEYNELRGYYEIGFSTDKHTIVVIFKNGDRLFIRSAYIITA